MHQTGMYQEKLAATHRHDLYQEAEKQRALRLATPSLRNALAQKLYRIAEWLEPEAKEAKSKRVLNVR